MATKTDSRLIPAAIGVTYAVVLTLIIELVLMMFIVPKFKDIFDDFDVTLPGLTLWLIDISTWFAGVPVSGEQFIPGYVLFLWIIACLLIPTIVLHIVFAKGKNAFVGLLTMCFLLLLNIPVLLVFSIAFFLPYIKMVQSVSETN
jgi:hypothetical protein